MTGKGPGADVSGVIFVGGKPLQGEVDVRGAQAGEGLARPGQAQQDETRDGQAASRPGPADAGQTAS